MNGWIEVIGRMKSIEAQISVIIPTYNRSSVIERAVQSVLNQSYQNWVLMIVDDGSTDNTLEVLDKYLVDERIRVISTENQGVSAARNLGIREAKTDWICFLDSDDEWLGHKLEKQIDLIKEGNKVIHTNEIWIRNGVRVNPHKKHEKKGGDIFIECIPLCAMSPSTIMIHRSIFNDVGVFKEDYPCCEDYDLWLRITAKYPVSYVEDFCINKYGGHEDQLSRQFIAMDYWRVKSLLDIVESKDLNIHQKKLVKETLNKKLDILMKGYLKHGNLEKYREVTSLYKDIH